MNDKELLMMAAKAAGYETKEDRHSGEVRIKKGDIWPCWNPLKDDGDALRLAVKLNLLVDNNGPYAECFAPTMKNTVAENHSGDPYAATRRAIVRAAAEIGGKL